MKVLYCLLLCSSIYGAQGTEDSVKLARYMDSIENKQKSAITYAKKIQELRSKRVEAIQAKLLEMKPISKKIKPTVSHSIQLNNKATKIEQYDVFFLDERYKVEFVPRSWFGRLFSKEKYKLKLIPIEKDTIINP